MKKVALVKMITFALKIARNRNFSQIQIKEHLGFSDSQFLDFAYNPNQSHLSALIELCKLIGIDVNELKIITLQVGFLYQIGFVKVQKINPNDIAIYDSIHTHKILFDCNFGF